MDENEKRQLLADVIAVNTVGDNEKDVAKILKDFFDKHGVESKIVDLDDGENRANLVAELKGSGEGKTLVYSGHMDVVSPGDVSEWATDPFELTEKDGKFFGRGVTDMKAGLVAMAIALVELKESGADFNGTLRLVATAGEESEMPGSQAAANDGSMDGAAALIVAEPSNGLILPAHKGSLQYVITAKGVGAHSSMPQFGTNALEIIRAIMNEFTPKLEEAAKANPDDVLGETFNVFTRLDAGEQVNSVPAKAVLYGNARTAATFDNDAVLDLLKEVIADVDKQTDGSITLDVLEDAAPIRRASDGDLVKAINAANEAHDYTDAWIRDENGLLKELADSEVAPGGVSGAEFVKAIKENPHPLAVSDGVTDASFLLSKEKDAEFSTFGPGVGPVAHKLDEYIYAEDFYAYAEKYVLIAKEFLK